MFVATRVEQSMYAIPITKKKKVTFLNYFFLLLHIFEQSIWIFHLSVKNAWVCKWNKKNRKSAQKTEYGIRYSIYAYT